MIYELDWFIFNGRNELSYTVFPINCLIDLVVIINVVYPHRPIRGNINFSTYTNSHLLMIFSLVF